ncbi:hypothetical protein WN48_10207 [Eufriesea mexicana]|nr:hypothetical protein WN48_10207 [Eufriesea mexicana]
MYKDLPCRCENFKCTCCLNIQMVHQNWNVCLNAALHPEDPILLLSLTVNNDVVLEYNVFLDTSTYCVRIFDWNFLQLCIGVKDIHFDGRNLHFCPEVHMKIFNLPEISLFYKCVNINAGGISIESFLLKYNRTIPQIEHQANEMEMHNKVHIE